MSEDTQNRKPTTLQTITDLVKNVWSKRQDGLVLPEEFTTKLPITHEQIAYLLSLYPYLQLVSTEAEHFYEAGPKIITVETGWTVHDYGDAISTSLGLMLFMANEYHLLEALMRGQGDEGEAGGGGKGGGGAGEAELKPGSGTVVKQAYDTAYEMIALAKEKNWPGVNIISGTEVMRFATWMAAQDLGLECDGFEPDAEALAKRARVKGEFVPKFKRPEVKYQ